MINVSEATKTAYTTDSSHKSLVITFPNANIIIGNDDIVGESFELIEGIESERNLTFQGCIASQVKFRIPNVVRDLRGEYVEVTIRAENTDIIPVFKGYVDTQDNLTHEDIQTEFTCYDVLYKIGSKNMQSWLDNLSFPRTVKQFRDSLFSNLGITQESVTLVNDALTISENVKNFLENPTALDLMRYICQMNARFGQIGRDGKFKYRKLWLVTEGLYPGDDTFPSSTTYPSGENAADTIDMAQYSTIEYQPYDTADINRVLIYDGGGITEGDYGSGTNAFSISDNPLAFSVNMQREAQNLYNEVSVIKHIPIVNIECSGRPWLECGDIIMSATRKNIIRSYILSRTLKGIQALMDTYSSDSDKYLPEAKANATSYINAERKKVLQVQADIVEMGELVATKATIDELNAEKVRVNGLLEAEEIRVNGLIQAEQVRVNGLLDAESARIGSLEADHVSIAQLNATNATIGTLSAREANFETVTAQNFNAVNGNISNLSASVANLNTVVAQKATIQQLNAVDAKFNNLNANNITAGTLSVSRMDVGTLASSAFSGLTVNVNRVYASHGITIGQAHSPANDLTMYVSGGIMFNGHNLRLMEITTVSGRFNVLAQKVS